MTLPEPLNCVGITLPPYYAPQILHASAYLREPLSLFIPPISYTRPACDKRPPQSLAILLPAFPASAYELEKCPPPAPFGPLCGRHQLHLLNRVNCVNLCPHRRSPRRIAPRHVSVPTASFPTPNTGNPAAICHFRAPFPPCRKSCVPPLFQKNKRDTRPATVDLPGQRQLGKGTARWLLS